MEQITLNNGVLMPIMGYGTYRISPQITQRSVTAALEAGYRSIDTAQCYGNEKEVGQACKSTGLPRQQLFITTKLWGCRALDDTRRSIASSLNGLGLDYIDLLLIHEPTGNVQEIYKAMEETYSEGKARSIGVSNFLEENFSRLLEHCQIIPAVNQVETHVFRQQAQLRELEKRAGTRHESWSPLASGLNDIFGNQTLRAIARKHHKSVAQICLRFLTQQAIIVIPRALDQQHMKENLQSLTFSLDPEDMEQIMDLDRGKSLFNWW